MSFIAHPEILRRRRIWQEREPINSQHKEKTNEELEREKEIQIQKNILQREREHQLHLLQFPIEKVYSNQESQVILIFSFFILAGILLIFPWNSPLKNELISSFFLKQQNNSSLYSPTAFKNIRSSKQPPLPQPASFPNPRRLDVKPLFIKKRPKTIPPAAIALPGIDAEKMKKGGEGGIQKLFGIGSGGVGGGGRIGEVKPTQSISTSSKNIHHSFNSFSDDPPPPPIPTKGSQDWKETLGKKVSKKLMKGKGKRYKNLAYEKVGGR